MITSSKGIQPNNSTDAEFRIWSKFIVDGMLAGGWVQTADTGQINFTTVTRPLAANTAMGYVILRMDDTLQSSVPVYVRLEFGSGSLAANMGVWFTIGGSTDGAGAIQGAWITNLNSAAAPIRCGSSSAALVQPHSWVSADTNRAQVAVAYTSGFNGLFFSIERTKTAAGLDDGTGLLLWYSESGASISRTLYLFALDGLQPPVENTAYHLLNTQRNPSARDQNVAVSALFHYPGLPQQPGMGLLIVNSADMSAEGRWYINIYGQRVPYQMLFTVGSVLGGSGRVLIRVD